MLRHFANGRVRWKNPIPCNTRTNWEFYAVIDGCCALRFNEQASWTHHTNMLWVFAPECSHGWSTVGEGDFHRLALHFSSVPYPLDEMVRQHGGCLSRDLTPEGIARLRTIGEATGPHFLNPTQFSPIHIQRLLLELSLLLVEGLGAASQPPALTDLGTFRIERALAWYAEHLAQRPTVEQVAAAIHVSPSHLRRLFGQVRSTSPKAVFQRIRVEKAQELMGSSTLTLAEVAAHCGYASASHLCRECQAVCHFTPTTWRKRLVDRFVDPPTSGIPIARECNVRPREMVLAEWPDSEP